MGWCSATEIMDTAVAAATKMTAHAWQIASGNEDARFPAFAEALRERPELGAELDNVLRPFVSALAERLREGDWDCIEESDYFDRFPQEMLGLDDARMLQWHLEHAAEAAEDGDTEAAQRHIDAHAALSLRIQEAPRGR